MKEFLQNNFPEFVLTLFFVIVGVILIFSIHWHDNEAGKWCMNTMTAIIVGLTAILNSIRQPKPNGSLSAEVHQGPPTPPTPAKEPVK